MKTLIPDTTDIGPDDLTDHEVIRHPAEVPVPVEHVDAEVVVVRGTPFDVLQESASAESRV